MADLRRVLIVAPCLVGFAKGSSDGMSRAITDTVRPTAAGGRPLFLPGWYIPLMGSFIEGRRIRLVPVDPDRHLDGCTRWVNDPRISRNLTLGVYPLSRSAERGWLEKMAAGSQTDIAMAIELLEDGRHIGMSGIHQINWVNRTAVTGSMIGETDMWGKGLGSEQARLRADYIFNTLNLRVIYSEFIEYNDPSRHMQAAAGYEVWGAKPKAVYKDGAYWDLIQTVLTREKWESLKAG